jgi:hypothetical protein
MVARNRQRTISIISGPLVLIAGAGMTDETNHHKPPDAGAIEPAAA